MMGSHSLKTICWYSATLILLASCKNKIRTRDKNISCRPGRRSRRSTWGSSSSARWPACCALSWRGCAARSGSAARSRGSRQQRNNPVKILISVGISLDLQFVIDDPIVHSPSCHFHKRHSRSLFQKVPSHKMATTPVDLVGSSPAKRTRVEKHWRMIVLQTTLSFPPGALR